MSETEEVEERSQLDGPSDSQGSIAPVHDVPSGLIVSVEHPCIIKNFDNGFKSLGGEQQLKHVLEHRVGDSRMFVGTSAKPLAEPVAGVSLRPGDTLAKKIPSTAFNTQNLLVKVTLPKRTGRKRKRGSDDPFTTEPHLEQKQQVLALKAPELLQRMRDNVDSYSIEAVGMISETHRFRGLPDFQLRTADLPIMREISEHAMPPSYDTLQEFDVLLQKAGPAFPAPPSLSNAEMPYQYQYQQAPDIVYKFDDAGNAVTENTNNQQYHGRSMLAIDPFAVHVPQGPPPDLDAGSAVRRAKYIKQINEVLDKTPILTIRVLVNELRGAPMVALKEALPWVCYTFASGPWCDALIKLGVDPRSDPAYRFTQMVRVGRTPQPLDLKQRPGRVRKLPSGGGALNTHIFDGTNVSLDSKVWRVCDITDPLIRKMLLTDDIRKECDPYTWGWYYNGTMTKARIIMSDKIHYIVEGQTPPEREYEIISCLPNIFTQENHAEVLFRQNEHNEHVMSLAGQIRQLIRTTLKRRRINGVEPAEGEQEQGSDMDAEGEVIEDDMGDRDGADDLDNGLEGGTPG